MTADYDEPDMAELAGIDLDPDYGRDIDDEDDRHTVAVPGDPDPHAPATEGQVFGYNDDPDSYDPDPWDDDNGEWQPGECDTCGGRDVVVEGPLGPLYCACAIGEGASVQDCRCDLSEGGNQ